MAGRGQIPTSLQGLLDGPRRCPESTDHGEVVHRAGLLDRDGVAVGPHPGDVVLGLEGVALVSAEVRVAVSTTDVRVWPGHLLPQLRAHVQGQPTALAPCGRATHEEVLVAHRGCPAEVAARRGEGLGGCVEGLPAVVGPQPDLGGPVAVAGGEPLPVVQNPVRAQISRVAEVGEWSLLGGAGPLGQEPQVAQCARYRHAVAGAGDDLVSVVADLAELQLHIRRVGVEVAVVRVFGRVAIFFGIVLEPLIFDAPLSVSAVTSALVLHLALRSVTGRKGNRPRKLQATTAAPTRPHRRMRLDASWDAA